MPRCSKDGLVADMEDGKLSTTCLPNGFWFVTTVNGAAILNDVKGQSSTYGNPVAITAPAMLLSPARTDSGQYVLHMRSNTTPPGSTLIGISLDQMGSTRSPFDVSSYTGVAFWARTFPSYPASQRRRGDRDRRREILLSSPTYLRYRLASTIRNLIASGRLVPALHAIVDSEGHRPVRERRREASLTS